MITSAGLFSTIIAQLDRIAEHVGRFEIRGGGAHFQGGHILAHIDRFFRSAAFVRIEVPMDKQGLKAMLRDLRALGEKEPAADPDRMLSEIRREIEACRGLLGQEGTEEKLTAQISRRAKKTSA